MGRFLIPVTIVAVEVCIITISLCLLSKVIRTRFPPVVGTVLGAILAIQMVYTAAVVQPVIEWPLAAIAILWMAWVGSVIVHLVRVESVLSPSLLMSVRRGGLYTAIAVVICNFVNLTVALAFYRPPP